METQNKLEIHHVAKRLPFGLKVKTIDGIFDVCGWSDEIGILLDTILYGANAIPEYKLILMPLSSSTETITIKVESFVPIEIIKSFKLGHVDWLTKEREHWIKEYGLEGYIGRTPNKIIEFFNENHFDYENLIEKGLAISVFDLTENPYA